MTVDMVCSPPPPIPVNALARFRVSILLEMPQRKHPAKKILVDAR
jgi:hypothetical protein